ncbi:MAG: hypothetical protein M1360_01030 [Candidatus Marsarchaeota archaeon]|jgi:hypothetical protein|nr:hypothetical protein [Candidatus Marsarchaeota archaeon]MCL5418507.1 hypothetical protein [Candidatus Marsarchaeota archaeon]
MIKEYKYGEFTPEKSAAQETDEKEAQQYGGLSIAEPLTFWIGMLLLAMFIELVVVPLSGSLGISLYKSTFNSIASYIVYLPGSIIIPLLVAVWLGERVGIASGGKNVAYKSIINAVYVSFVYLIAILIIFLIAKYTNLALFPSLLPSMGAANFLVYLVGIPVAIVLVLAPLFSMLSAARHK